MVCVCIKRIPPVLRAEPREESKRAGDRGAEAGVRVESGAETEPGAEIELGQRWRRM